MRVVAVVAETAVAESEFDEDVPTWWSEDVVGSVSIRRP